MYLDLFLEKAPCDSILTLLMALSFMIQLSLKQIKQQDKFNHNIHSFALWLV